jgi:preprotein translocase subunit SecD
LCIITGHFPFSRIEGFSWTIIVTVVMEVIITLMMQQMHAYMLPGAAKSLGIFFAPNYCSLQNRIG